MESPAAKTPLVVIVGETASGKTATAIELAKQVGGEIICADSRTIYQQMDIGTAKPTLQEQKAIPHHAIDIVKPDQRFSAAQFKQLAQKCIQEIAKKGKVPILVGGTGLYIDAVLYDFQFANRADEAYRARLEQMSDEDLITLLHTKNIDSTGVNTKNRRHLIRLIERGGKVRQERRLPENAIILGLKLDREVLKDRIIKRIDRMFKEGFLAEVETLVSTYGWEHESMSGIGYRVVRAHLEGSASLEEAKQAFVRRDISLAKRQRTWFKRNADIQWFDDPRALIKAATAFVYKQKV